MTERFPTLAIVAKNEASMKASHQPIFSRTIFLQTKFSQTTRIHLRALLSLLLIAVLSLAVVACDSGAPAVAEEVSAATAGTDAATTEEAPQAADPGAAEVLPALEPVTLAEG